MLCFVLTTSSTTTNHPCTTGRSLVKSRERRARLTLKDIGQRKKRRALAMIGSYSSSSSLSSPAATAAWGQSEAGAPVDQGVFATVVRAATALIPGLRSSSSPSSGGHGGGSSFLSSAEVGGATVRVLVVIVGWREFFLLGFPGACISPTYASNRCVRDRCGQASLCPVVGGFTLCSTILPLDELWRPQRPQQHMILLL